ncbi:MAG: hypothetical protein CL916_09425 [Deltaproteobacteria bacterium]|nr:hypothetical protein [Deltaproteobacteria bacterium]
MKSKIFLLSLCAACYEQPEQLDPYDVLNATVEQVILPDLDTFKRTAEDLKENSVLFCQDPSQGRLQTLQFSWKGGKKMLKTMELLSFGPYNFGEIDVSRRLDNWPERGEGIEDLIAGDQIIDTTYLQSMNRADLSLGYPALGYLLHSDEEAEDVRIGFQDERRCSYLMVQTELNMEIVNEFYQAWSPQGMDYASEITQAGKGSSSFTSPQEAIGGLLQSMNRLVLHMADLKLAQPLDMGRRDSVEAKYSGSSLKDLHDNLDAIEKLYAQPSPSISDYIQAYQGADVDVSILDGFSNVRSVLDAIPEPLSQSIVDEPQKVAELIVALEALSDVFTNDAERFLMHAPHGY